VIEQEQFDAWLREPVTVALMKVLNAKREALRQDWEGGSFTDYSKDAAILVNVGNMGTCKGYAFVTDLDYEQLIGEIDGEESKRPPAPRGSSFNPSV